ncbi:OmpA family protein [Aliiroseovarius sp. 2305UL8-7]|uniref:OmpA family protein n=1 Tax=Aliiroseovarius conchicola TaxID=3121637 RepID=UPI003529723D
MKLSAILTAASIFLAATLPATANEVELAAKSGNQAPVRGELVAVHSDSFVLRTNIGVVTFDRDDVTCSGVACPVALKQGIDMTVVAPAELAGVIVPLLADGFAERQEREARLVMPDGVPIGEEIRPESIIDSNLSFNILLPKSGEQEEVNIAVDSSGAAQLFGFLASGGASLVFSEQPVDDAAVQTVAAAGHGNLRAFKQERVVAVDGYVAVANHRSSVSRMSVQQVADVLSGKINNWSTFGGPDREINVYSFSPEAEAFHHIEDLILKPSNVSLTRDVRKVSSTRELTRSIEQDRFGFGVVKYSSVRGLRPISLVNECGMVMEPTAFNIKSEEYTLQNRVTAYSTVQTNGFTARFLDYLDDESLDDLVSKAGLISLSTVPEERDDGRARLLTALDGVTDELSASQLKNFVQDVLASERLSTTFRFAPSSSVLDNKAKRDVARVLRYVSESATRRLVLAGFSDSNGQVSQNEALSLSRAEAVRNQLLAAATNGELSGVEITVRGYGELSPVACNETFEGRATNRRVEIWVE